MLHSPSEKKEGPSQGFINHHQRGRGGPTNRTGKKTTRNGAAGIHPRLILLARLWVKAA